MTKKLPSQLTDKLKHFIPLEYDNTKSLTNRSNYSKLAEPTTILCVQNLYDAYKNVMESKGIVPLSYENIEGKLKQITFIDFTGRRRLLLNQATVEERATNALLTDTVSVIVLNKFNRIAFIEGMYDKYKVFSIKDTTPVTHSKFKISRFMRNVSVSLLIDLIIIIHTFVTKIGVFSVYLVMARSSAIIILVSIFLLFLQILNVEDYISDYISHKTALNDSTLLHIVFGIKISIASAIHVIGHFLHLNYVMRSCKAGCDFSIVRVIKPSTYKNNVIKISWNYFFKQFPYISGVILVLILVALLVIVVLSRYQKIRMATFYNFHKLLALLFFIFVILHGIVGLLGLNLSYVFVLPMVLFYIWTRQREILYNTKLNITRWHITESMIRVYFNNSTAMIKTLERCVTISIFVNHPEVSKAEWHPFTLSFGANKMESILNIRLVGSWTKKFHDRILLNSTHQIHQHMFLGHYTPSCFRFYKFYTSRAYFCSGIGITPFITIMNNEAGKSSAYNILVWSVRDVDIIQEFSTILNQIIALDSKLQVVIFYSNSSKEKKVDISNDLIKYNFLQALIHYYFRVDIVHGEEFPYLVLLQRMDATSTISRIINQCDSDDNLGIFVCGGPAYAGSINKAVEVLKKNDKDVSIDLWIEPV